MPAITTKDGTQIYYKDWSKGPVVTFSHGWEGLKEKSRKRPCLKNRGAPEVEEEENLFGPGTLAKGPRRVWAGV